MPCSMCNCAGHYRTTCILWENLQCLLCEEIVVVKEKRPLICSRCNCVGHNKRTCLYTRSKWCGKHVRFDDPIQIPTTDKASAKVVAAAPVVVDEWRNRKTRDTRRAEKEERKRRVAEWVNSDVVLWVPIR